MGSTDSRNGLQIVFEQCVNLRRIRLTSQSLPLESCRLPATIDDVALDAGSFDPPTAENLQQAAITRLELRFCLETDVTSFADLPWISLQTLVLIFSFDTLEAITSCIHRLALQSLDGSKATNLQGLEVKLMSGVNDLGETVLDQLRRAFQLCPMTNLTLFCDGPDLGLQLDGDWSALEHLSLHLHTFRDHQFQGFAIVLDRCDDLLSLTIRDFSFGTCECCDMGIEDFIALGEKYWLPSGRNLIAVVYLVRHRTAILDLRIQTTDGRRELRWTRADAADDFALKRWTLF